MLKFGAGFVAGFAALFVLMLIFGDYSDGAPAPVALAQADNAVPQEQPTNTPVVTNGLSYAQICEVDENNMTDPQLKALSQKYVGQTFDNWQGFVYDVVDRGNGQYDLQIAMQERGPFWSRNIAVENIPTDLALRLNVEQTINFSGHIAQVDYMFDVMCNPMTVDNFVMH